MTVDGVERAEQSEQPVSVVQRLKRWLGIRGSDGDSPLGLYLRNTVIAGAAAAVAVALYSVTSSPDVFWRALGLAAVSGLASFWLVGLIGFLFGIPPADAEGAPANQSLEEISSWLTKIIIGAGLVQIREIAAFVYDVGVALGESSTLEAGPELFTALIIATGTSGFVFFYFWAYMYWNRLRRSAISESLGDIDRLQSKGLVADDVADSVRVQLVSDHPKAMFKEPKGLPRDQVVLEAAADELSRLLPTDPDEQQSDADRSALRALGNRLRRRTIAEIGRPLGAVMRHRFELATDNGVWLGFAVDSTATPIPDDERLADVIVRKGCVLVRPDERGLVAAVVMVATVKEGHNPGVTATTVTDELVSIGQSLGNVDPDQHY